jgi:hypothetical protein
MKKHITRRIAFLLILMIAGVSLPPAIAQAASAEAELTTEAAEVKVGEEFFVYLTITSKTEFGDVEAALTYDDTILEYQSGSSYIKGGSGYLKVSDREVTDGSKKRKYTMKFEATEVGICDITFSEGNQIMVYDIKDGLAMSVSSNTLTINVTAPETASSNTRLKELRISPSLLTPEFSPDIYDYSTEVSYDTEKLVIVALPEDDKSTVSVTGNDKLSEGKNKITIQVLAESGANIEYSINAVKEAAPTVTDPEVSGTPEESTKDSFRVVKEEDGKYVIYSGKYKLLEPDSSIVIPEGYKKTNLLLSDVSVTAYYPENDLSSDFLLLYAQNESGEVGFYQYDKIEKTIQRYVQRKETVVSNTVSTADPEAEQKYRTNLNRAAIVIALLCAACALLITLLIRAVIKGRGYKEDDLE